MTKLCKWFLFLILSIPMIAVVLLSKVVKVNPVLSFGYWMIDHYWVKILKLEESYFFSSKSSGEMKFFRKWRVHSNFPIVKIEEVGYNIEEVLEEVKNFEPKDTFSTFYADFKASGGQ